MSVHLHAVAQQEFRFLFQPTTTLSAAFGLVGWGLSNVVPIKETAGLVFGLSGSLISTIVAPIFLYMTTNESTQSIEELVAISRLPITAFLFIGGAIATEVLVGWGVSSVGILAVPVALQYLVIGCLVKMVARLLFHTINQAFC